VLKHQNSCGTSKGNHIKLSKRKNGGYRRWCATATQEDLKFSCSHHYRPIYLQKCHSVTQNYKNDIMGWKWWPSDMDSLTDMAQLWQWCGNHVVTLSWPYDKCPSSKICSTKYLKTIRKNN